MNRKLIKVKLCRSPIGYESSQRATLASLGLRKLNKERVYRNSPALQGMLRKVRHLVEVSEVEDEAK
jgi:large subunit ribosomal protein L30